MKVSAPHRGWDLRSGYALPSSHPLCGKDSKPGRTPLIVRGNLSRRPGPALPEHGERLLIGGAVVGGHGLFDAIELNRNDALSDPFLVGLGGNASSEGPAAVGG